MKSKKGQMGATSAATLIAIIAGLIVLYILVLPPAEREKLLEGNATEDGEDIGEVKEVKTLLSINPGRLDYLAQKEIEHIIPSVNLNIITEAVVLKEVDSIYVKRALFSEEKSNISFSIEDLENTEDVLLNFIATRRSGRLIIKLNGREIFNRELGTYNIEPIKLKEHLQNFNVLEFTASSPDAAFWRTNEYLLENIIITSNIIKRGGQESKNIFIVSSSEKANLEKAILRFSPECITGLVGPLNVWINNYNIYSAVPDCGALSPPIDVPEYYLVSGENRLIFRTSEGNYLIDHIKVTSKLKKIEYPVYYFEVTEKQYEKIEDEKANVTFNMRFVDDIERKIARIIINGHMISLDQYDIDFEDEITSWIEEGNNAIKIEPQKTIDVVELEVVYERRG
jgi:hypothetical protein